jgi:ABC-type uncharacterized transport system substrate-binding protein
MHWLSWMNKSRITAALCSTVLLFVSVGTGVAHPHLFITTRYTVVFDQDGLTGVKVSWVFDEMYSSMTATDFDEDGDGILGEQECDELVRLAKESLPISDFFTHITINDVPFPVKSVSDFVVYMKDGMLNYQFLVSCQVAVGNKKTKVKISSYDSEFFAALFFAQEKPFEVKGAKQFKIVTEIGEDPDTLIYFDTIHPWTLTLVCHKKEM